jgi:flagellar biosynthetic protein FliO
MKEIGEIISLVLIMAAIFALTWLTTKFLSKRLPGSGKTSRMQVVERMPFGKDRQVVLVKVGEEHILVDVTGQQISFGPAVRVSQPVPADMHAVNAESEALHENEKL